MIPKLPSSSGLLVAAALAACGGATPVTLGELVRAEGGQRFEGRTVRLTGTVARTGKEELLVEHRQVAGYARPSSKESVPYAVLQTQAVAGQAFCYFHGETTAPVQAGHVVSVTGKVQAREAAERPLRVNLYDCRLGE